MKKVFLFLVVSVYAICADAQFYVGGTFGYLNEHKGDNVAYCKILPEIGYNFDTKLSVGVILGYTKNWAKIIPNNNYNQTCDNGFTIQPYARYKFFSTGILSIYGEANIGYTQYKDVGSEFSIYVRPVASLDITKHVSVISKVGFVGYDLYSPKASDEDNKSLWGINLDGNTLEFGAIYKF